MFNAKKCPPGCAYAMLVNSNGAGGEKIEHCGYILYTGKIRGCDPGPGCTRYTAKRKKRGPKFTWDEPTGKKMWIAGKTDREIADALGVKREIVGKTRRRKWVKEADNHAQTMAE